MTQQQQEQQYDELSMVPANILEQYAHDYSQARAASKVTGFWTRKEVDFPIDTSKFEYVDGVWAETAEAGEQRRQHLRHGLAEGWEKERLDGELLQNVKEKRTRAIKGFSHLSAEGGIIASSSV